MKTHESVRHLGAQQVQTCLADEDAMGRAVSQAFSDEDQPSITAWQTVRRNPVQAGAIADRMAEERRAA